MTSDKFSRLEERVDQIVDRIQVLTKENSDVRAENGQLKKELTGLRREFDSLKVAHADQADAVRTKLSSVLERIGEIEALDL